MFVEPPLNMLGLQKCSGQHTLFGHIYGKLKMFDIQCSVQF